MAYELFLAHLVQSPAHEAEDLVGVAHSVAIACLPPSDERWFVGEAEPEGFEIEMPLGSVAVSTIHVAVRLDGIDLKTARLIFEIARRAKLDIVNAGGHPPILLGDAAHFDFLSPALQSENPVLCNSAEELYGCLSPNFDFQTDEKRDSIRRRDRLYGQWTHNHYVRSIGFGDPEPNVPGLGRSRGEEPIYLEMKPNERGLLMHRRFGRFIREKIKAGSQMPDGGGTGGSSWEIRIPTGDVFGCLYLSGYHFSDDREASREHRIQLWKQILSEFARTSGRRTATINGHQFSVSDGSSYAIAECESRRANDDDG
jgi:hypothetical protein